jgi:MYXO-CTERM domain-containing protein
MNNSSRLTRRVLALALSLPVLAAALAASRPAQAAVYSYVDWTVVDVAKGTASGTITLPDASTVTVTFAAINPDGTAGNLYGAQIDGAGTNYWVPATPYMSPLVENAPPGTDILQLSGGVQQIYKVTLSEPIKDPVMAIVSLGSPSITTSYNFDSPFTIVSQGAGYWGGGDTALVQLPNNVLQGTEGHGTIRFVGTFATFSWTVPVPESWHGFNFAIRTTERLEPTPDAAADGPGDGGGPPDVNSETSPADAGLDRASDVVADAAADGPSDAARSDGPTAPRKSGCDCAMGAAAGGGNAGMVVLPALFGLLALARARRRR